MNLYLQAIRKFGRFKGRASQKEFWSFAVIHLIFLTLTWITDLALGTNFLLTIKHTTISLPFGYIALVYALATITPSLSLTVRRLHDIDKSGWNLLFALIPIIGVLWFFDMMLTSGMYESNKYGATPRNLSFTQGKKTFHYN